MIRNYLKTAIRNIVARKFYTLINIAGLTTGIAVGLLILLWVQDEYSVDAFHSKADHIYKVNITDTGAHGRIYSWIIAPVATFARQEIPAVKDAARIMGTGGNVPFAYRDKVMIEDRVVFADASLFGIFDFSFTGGNARQPYANDASLVISRSLAVKYFGKEDPIGKQVNIGNDELFNISGVVEDMPVTSAVRYDVFIPIQRFNRLAYKEGNVSYNSTSRLPSMDADWHRFGFETYLLLNSGADIKKLERQLQAIHERNKPDDAPVPYIAQPIKQMHLYRADGTDGGIDTVRIFSLVALLIMLVACINYVNLSTARAMLRAKEVSVRKMIGAARFQLLMQFLIETALVFMVAVLLAVGVMYLLLPLYNQLSGKHLLLQMQNRQAWLYIGLALLGTLAAAGIYPALLLSSFKPLQALKGKVTAGVGNVSFRRVLVVVQFSVSVVLIIATLIIGNQLGYIRNKNLGYDKENTLFFTMRDKMQPHYEAVKAELLKQPGVLAVTRTSANMLQNGEWTGDTDWEGKPENKALRFRPMWVDETTIPFFKIPILQGAGFTGSPADSFHIMVNETAVKEMGLTDPIGKRLRIQKVNGVITAVVKDYHFSSMREKIEPVAILYNHNNAWRMYIKIAPGHSAKVAAAVEREWKRYNGQVPASYSFMEDDFNKLYLSEQRVSMLSWVFAAVTIILSCLGLLGLATFSAQVKTREIGIRKVLGAGVTGIVQMLAREFMLLVLVSLLIGMPLAWWAMNKWLANFAYRTSIGWSVFLLAGIAALLIAFISVGFQAAKAALANPVKSLRSE